MPKERVRLDRSEIANDPDYIVLESSGEVCQQIFEVLEETVYGQPEACAEVAMAITRSLGGFCDPNRPQFVGLFMGEPGVGKTEMGRAVAKLFDPVNYKSRLTVIDCNMFQQSHDVERILGAPPSYVGYGDEPLISGKFLKEPNVIVFDEIEKADVALHRLLLRVMDKGKLELNRQKGGVLDFSRSVILMTSNLGSYEIVEARKGKRGIGFNLGERDCKVQASQQIGVAAAEEFWRYMPEFLNRIDSTVVFNPLNEEICYLLVDKFLGEYCLSQSVDTSMLLATEQLKEWIVGQVNVQSAGRELRRLVDRLVVTAAAEVSFGLPKRVPLIADISQDGSERVVFWVNTAATKVRYKTVDESEDGNESDEVSIG